MRFTVFVDINPPQLADYTIEMPLIPYPYTVRTYSLPSLYAGKLHALICRKWINRVKGRDFYDFIWYISRGQAVNVDHLKSRMVQSGHFDIDKKLDLVELKSILENRINEVDFNQAKEDVRPFIANPVELDIWSKDFFINLLKSIKVHQP